MVFPVLDVTRLAVRHPDLNRELCDGNPGDQLMSTLQLYLQPSPGPNQMLSLRILCNMLAHAHGEALVTRNSSFLLQQLDDCAPPFTKPLEVSYNIFIFNLIMLCVVSCYVIQAIILFKIFKFVLSLFRLLLLLFFLI